MKSGNENTVFFTCILKVVLQILGRKFYKNTKNQSAVSTVIGRHLKIERIQELKNSKSLQNYFQDV